uniref:Uncharacterized protein n=1 Tax=Rhipicephalus zambeziensis TaxID=60191 RepID=A0A224YFZ6_9ACAR
MRQDICFYVFPRRFHVYTCTDTLELCKCKNLQQQSLAMPRSQTKRLASIGTLQQQCNLTLKCLTSLLSEVYRVWMLQKQTEHSCSLPVQPVKKLNSVIVVFYIKSQH